MVTDRIKARDVYCLCNPDSFLNTLHNLPSSFLQQDDIDDFTRRLREIKQNNTCSNSFIEEDLSVNSNNVFSRDAYSQEEEDEDEEEEEEKHSDIQSERRTTEQYHHSKSQMKNDDACMYSTTEPTQYQQNERQDCEKINEGVDNNQLLSYDQQFDLEILDRSKTLCSYEIYKTLPPPPPPPCTPPAMKQKKQQSVNPCRHATSKTEKLSSGENLINGSRSDGERRVYYDAEEDSNCAHKINNLPSRNSPEAERREGNNSFDSDGTLPPCWDTYNTLEVATTRKTSVQIFQDDSDDQVNMSPAVLRGRREDNQPSFQSSFRSRQQKMNRIRIAALQIKESFREGADDRLDMSNALLSMKARNYLHG
jgi:hypothetical protein